MKRMLGIFVALLLVLTTFNMALAEEVTDVAQDASVVSTETVESEPASEVTETAPEVTETQEVATEVAETLTQTEATEITESIDGTVEEVTAENVGATPDQYLPWGLKRLRERLTLMLTLNEGKKAEKKMLFAQRRLMEIKLMAEKKNLKALAKAQRVHAKLLQEVAESQEDILAEDVAKAESIEANLQKHIQVLELVQKKLTEKGVPTQGIDNALVKSRNAIDKYQSLSAEQKQKIAKKVKGKQGKPAEETEAEEVEETETVETSEEPVQEQVQTGQ